MTDLNASVGTECLRSLYFSHHMTLAWCDLLILTVSFQKVNVPMCLNEEKQCLHSHARKSLMQNLFTKRWEWSQVKQIDIQAKPTNNIENTILRECIDLYLICTEKVMIQYWHTSWKGRSKCCFWWSFLVISVGIDISKKKDQWNTYSAFR